MSDDDPIQVSSPPPEPKIIGVGALAEQLGLEPGERWGKWCSRCEGVWFGWIFEVTCPGCGNRRG